MNFQPSSVVRYICDTIPFMNRFKLKLDMRKLFLILAVSAFAFQVSSAQTVDEILANCWENMGGLDKIKAMQTRKMTIDMSMQGMQFIAIMSEQAPDKRRVDVDIQGMELVQAYDGENAWTINPFASGTDPQRMPDNEAEEFTRQPFEDSFIDYAEKGHTVELEGTEEVEGAECFKLKLTKKSGDVEYHFFDTEYFVPIMARTTAGAGPMAGMEAETFLSDYQEVEGIMFPFHMETKVQGQSVQTMTITDVEINPEIDASIFDFPAAKKEEMVGEGADKMDAEKEKMLKEAPKGEMKDKAKMEKSKAKKKKNN